MGNKACPLRLTLAAIALAFLGAANHADAQTFSVLYNLASNSGPYGGVVFDSAGNLYGTTSGGGTYSGGTVYELSPQAGGGWTETILHPSPRRWVLALRGAGDRLRRRSLRDDSRLWFTGWGHCIRADSRE